MAHFTSIVLGEDPTVHLLQNTVAKMFEKEAALFVPTGTMSNLCAIIAHSAHMRAVGKEIIVGAGSHISQWEQGNASYLAGVHSRQVPDNPFMSHESIRSAYRSDNDDHYAQTCLICIENTHNLNGGKVLTKDYIDQVGHLAHSELDQCKSIPLHIDGARIFNATISAGIPVSSLCESADSISICLSKGLGAPAGSVLVGSESFIHSAKRARKALGGGMRQSGVIAAMGLYAIENNIERLVEDHKRARRLSQELHSHGFDIAHDDGVVDSNLLFFGTPQSTNISQSELCSRLNQEYSIKMGGGYIRSDNLDRPLIRIAVHKEINDEHIERTIDALVALCC